LRGEAGTILKHTGSGNAVIFDDPGGLTPIQANWVANVRMENFIIQGNTATTNGLFLRGVRNGIFKHISVRNVSNAGLWSEACVTNILENFRVSHWENNAGGIWNVTPAYGIVLASRGIDATTTWTIENPVIEGVSGIGIWIQVGCFSNTLINGTAEGNPGKGIVIQSYRNTIINTDFEANVGNDIEISGDRNALINVSSSNNLIVSAGAGTKLIGGSFHNISLNGPHQSIVMGIDYTGTFIDTDDQFSTIKMANVGPSSDGYVRYDTTIRNPISRMIALNSSGNVVNSDCRLASSFYTAVYANFLLSNPTNPTNGQRLTWRIQQGGAGGNQIMFGSKFRPKAGQPFPVLSTPLNSNDYISAIYNSTWDIWDIQ
jgi:hypothetical protein